MIIMGQCNKEERHTEEEMKREESRQKMRWVGNWLKVTFISLCEDFTRLPAGTLVGSGAVWHSLVSSGKCEKTSVSQRCFSRLIWLRTPQEGASTWTAGHGASPLEAPGAFYYRLCWWKHKAITILLAKYQRQDKSLEQKEGRYPEV